jgi:hypothetical protein
MNGDMRGDFSQIRFSPRKNYTSVLEQQGRVALDADANEQCAINDYLRTTETVDAAGKAGGPVHDEGFKIAVEGNAIHIGKGRYYVDGILCENPEPLLYSEQPFLINPNPTDQDLLLSLSDGSISTIQVYLQVWRRLVTALDDPCLAEPALGQADTTARLQTVWRVVAQVAPSLPTVPGAGTLVLTTGSPTVTGTGTSFTTALKVGQRVVFASDTAQTPYTVSAIVSDSSLTLASPYAGASTTTAAPVIQPVGGCCESMVTGLVPVRGPGKLCAQTGGDGGDCSCQPTPAAGYRGLENQLYRVEIHQAPPALAYGAPAGNETAATCKWSRENGFVVVAVTGVSGSQVYVDSLGPDPNLGFSPGQWVEISDDSYLFGQDPNQPGNLYQIQSVSSQTLSVTMTQPVASVDPTKNARMRRWDQFGSSATSNGVGLSAGSWLDLENGIQVQFASGQYESGDYWLIPARTATGNIQWPPCNSDGNAFQPAHHIEVFDAPLACIEWQNDEFTVQDCRRPFYPLTELTPSATPAAMHVTGISWSNDDIMTLDQLVLRPISGTVSVTPDSPTVNGNGTSFTTQLTSGQFLLFAIDEALYQISTITSDTQLTLTSNYRGDISKSTTALTSGLTVALDQVAPQSDLLTPANFVVTLEVAIPLPLAAGSNALKAVAAFPEPFRSSILPLLQTASPETAASLRVAAKFSAVAVAAETVVNVIRFSLILDGYLSSAASALNWLPILALGSDIYTIGFINGLLSIGSAQGVPSRVRVKVEGRTIFTTNSNGTQIYLDGQSFGIAGSFRIDGTPRIDLQLPSGNNAKASDFESWFYLAPIVNLVSLTVSPSSITFTPSGPPSPATATGTVTLNYAPGVDTAITLSVAATTPGAPQVVSVPPQVVVPKNANSQTFNISAYNTNLFQSESYVITASLPPALGMSRSQTATLNVAGYEVAQ